MFIYATTSIYFGLIMMIPKALPYITVIDKGILPVDKNSIGIQMFMDVKNDHHSKACQIHSWPKMCCFDDYPYKDYCTDSVYGDNIDFVMAKRRDRLVFVYPTLFHHDQVGQCDFVINYQCGQHRIRKQTDVSIEFNTKINNKNGPKYLQSYKGIKRSVCNSLDEDTLNACTPVNCDLKYSGRKPYFDITRNKCVIAPTCLTDLTKAIPDIVYVPKINICRDLDQSIMLADIYAINSGIGVVTEATEYLPNPWKIQIKSNCSTVSENIKLLKDLITGNLSPILCGDTTSYSECCMQAILSICGCILAITIVTLSTICCVHVTISWYKSGCNHDLKDAVDNFRRKFKKDNIIRSPSRVSKDVTNNLLKEVIVRDLPLELRDSMVDLCDRISREVRSKRRYRLKDLGSRVNFEDTDTESSCSSSARSKHSDVSN